MARLQELHPDQQAVLRLVLGRRMAYADLARILGLTPEQVRERALDAIDGLAPDDIDGLELDDRDRIADYLLGQQNERDRTATEQLLKSKRPAQEWLARLTPELGAIANVGLPPLPGEPGSVPPSADLGAAFAAVDAAGGGARPTGPRFSRRTTLIAGGAGGLVVLVVVVLLVAGAFGGGDDKGSEQTAAETPAATTTTETSDTALATAVASALPQQVNFNAPRGATGAAAKAVAVGQTNINDNVPGLVFQAKDLPKLPANRVYAIWVDGGGQPPALLGRLDKVAETGDALVDKNGAVAKVFVPFATLDATTGRAKVIDVRQYGKVRVTEESPKATRPGRTVLSGSLKQ